MEARASSKCRSSFVAPASRRRKCAYNRTARRRFASLTRLRRAPDVFEFDVHMNGLPIATDVSIITAMSNSTSAVATNRKAATFPLTKPEKCPFIAYEREQLKGAHYNELCAQNDWTFAPLVFTDLGAPGPATMRHVRCLARSCRAKCEPWMFWLHFRHISVAVQLGTFFLARAIRAKMLHTARKRRAERSSTNQAADIWLPAPE